MADTGTRRPVRGRAGGAARGTDDGAGTGTGPRVPRPRRLRRSAEERTRRRFVRRRRTQRWLRWRPLLAAVLVLSLLGGSAWAVLFSDLLAAEDVSVTGTQLLGKRQVSATADVPIGTPLARVDLAAVERRVESLAEVEDATVTRSWPHGVVVRVTERTAVAVVELAGGLRGMDADGVLFRDYGKAPRNLPRVLMPSGTTSDAMVEAAAVIEALPDEPCPASTTSRCRAWTTSRWCCAAAAGSCGGARTPRRRRPGSSPSCCRP